jgi:tRNA (cmo5U34)-methyltransferase
MYRAKKSTKWNFNLKNISSFEKHIDKSVPFYKNCHFIFLSLSDFFIQKNSRIIDLGCSSGNYLSKLYDKNKFDISLAFEGYDAVPEMIKFCKKKYNKKKINFFKKDVVNINFKNSSLISSFYTIQFIKQSKRQKLINRIYNGLNKNGAFFFIEKVLSENSETQNMFTQIYNEFKIKNGISPANVLKKSKSLKGVLMPLKSSENIKMLKKAGFKNIQLVIKYGQFEGILAIKNN